MHESPCPNVKINTMDDARICCAPMHGEQSVSACFRRLFRGPIQYNKEHASGRSGKTVKPQFKLCVECNVICGVNGAGPRIEQGI